MDPEEAKFGRLGVGARLMDQVHVWRSSELRSMRDGLMIVRGGDGGDVCAVNRRGDTAQGMRKGETRRELSRRPARPSGDQRAQCASRGGRRGRGRGCRQGTGSG